MLKKVKSIMMLTVALWGFVGALHNLVDWNGTIAAVGAVTSMVTFEGGADGWQATSNPILIWAGAIFIILSKLVAAILCSIGGIRMWRENVSDEAAYYLAKNMALAGCGVAMIMLFGGFIVIAESWFELWRSESMLGPVLQSSFRYGGMIGLIALFVASKD
jgi:predicted small integral membrane protein